MPLDCLWELRWSQKTLVHYHERVHSHKYIIGNDSGDTIEIIENDSVYDVGVDVESLSEKKNDHGCTFSGDIVYDVFLRGEVNTNSSWNSVGKNEQVDITR